MIAEHDYQKRSEAIRDFARARIQQRMASIELQPAIGTAACNR